MKEFEHFLKKDAVKSQSPDNNLSSATYTEAKNRLEFSKQLSLEKQSKYVLENAYESMREAADALLYKKGFKSYSHEASIVFLKQFSFTQKELEEFDQYRKIRNNIKYYGGNCDVTEAKSALKLADKIIPKIGELLQ